MTKPYERVQYAHLERILLVLGKPDAGKSRLLRSMFVDERLGTNGEVPSSDIKKIALKKISRERVLYVRLTSPHEYNESLQRLLDKIDRVLERVWRHIGWRVNIALPLQPLPANSMRENTTDICRALIDRYTPERIRIVQISPRQDNEMGHLLSQAEVDQLRELKVEIMTIDGRRGKTKKSEYANGLLLADYFDFT